MPALLCGVINKFTDAQQTLSFPSPLIEGYSFSYHGILGVWEGFRPLHAHISAQPTPRIPQRGLLLDAPPPTPPHVAHDSHRHRGESRHTTQQSSRPPPDDQDDDFLAAISILNARKDSGQSDWRPPVATAKLGQRQLALYLCGWSLADGDLGNAIKKYLIYFFRLTIVLLTIFSRLGQMGARAQAFSSGVLARFHGALQASRRSPHAQQR